MAEISERIVYLEARARVRMAEWLDLVAEFDCRNGAHRRGFRGTAEWIAFECRMDRRTARDHVRVARRLRELPMIAAALGEGRLSYSQVRAVTRAGDDENEAELLRVALTSTTHQLEQHVRQLRSAASADPDVAKRGRARRHFAHFWDEDGSLRFFGRLPAEDGVALVEAVHLRATQMPKEDGPPAGRADALVDLVTSGGTTTELVLHADPAALACTARNDEPRAGEVLYLRAGPAIPSAVARRLTCDAKVTVDGLNLGRTTRLVTAAQRRGLEARDGRVCSMPGCTRSHDLHAHHLTHWVHGGRTDLDNLALFCHYHHRLFHDDGWCVQRERDGGLVIRDPAGRQLCELPERAPPLLLAA